MALISEQISNLINGVSQQPPSIRLASQCEEQINGLSTVAEGLKKRPPLEHVTKMNNKTDTDAHVHWINRDSDNRFVIITSSDQFSADFSDDFTGAEMEAFHLETTIDTWDAAFTTDFGTDEYHRELGGFSGDALSYLSTVNARDNLQMFTVADFTFMMNKTVTVAKDSTTGDTRNPEAIVFLKQASNAHAVKISVDGVDIGTITASNDANAFVDSIETRLNTVSGLTVTKFGGSNVHITRGDGADFTLHVQAPETVLTGIKDTVVDFTDLPATTKDGFTIKITGDPGSSSDDYWIKHVNQGDADVGEWVETVEPGLANSLDETTLPFQLVRGDEDAWDDAFADDFGVEDFSISAITWVDRAAGDEETAPDPSFVGETLNDMFFHKNRFGFLANENVILSELGEFFNFYATTATDLLDTDMIDLAAPSNQVSVLHHAVAFNEDLMMFSDFAQFKLTEFAAGGLTPSNAKLSLLTEYEHDNRVAPVINGRKIYFADENDGFTVLREFGIIEDLQEETAEDITSHVPSYIKGAGFEIVPHDDFLFVLSDENLNEIFVYKFLFQDGQKKLSSWSKWQFKAEEKVIGAKIIDHIMYFAIVRPDGTYLDKMSLQDANLVGLTESSTQLPFKVHLDRLVELKGDYDIENNRTTWTLPYPDDFGWTYRVIFGPSFTGKEGGLVQGVTQINETQLRASGNHTAGNCFVGKEYQFRYEFSEPNIKTEVAGRQTKLAGGVTKIRKWNIDYFNTGFFKMQVTAPGRDAFSYVFTGRILGSPINKIGEVPFETGEFKKMIMADAKDLKIELISDSYLPCAFTGADWEGNRVVRTVPRR